MDEIATACCVVLPRELFLKSKAEHQKRTGLPDDGKFPKSIKHRMNFKDQKYVKNRDLSLTKYVCSRIMEPIIKRKVIDPDGQFQ